MAKLRINGDSSGYVDLEAPNAASSSTLDLDQVPQKNVTNTFTTSQTIQNDNSYWAANIAESNNAAIALRITPTRAGYTKGISLGAIGNSGALSTGIQAYDTSDNSANTLQLNPHGGAVTTPQQPSFGIESSYSYSSTGTGEQVFNSSTVYYNNTNIRANVGAHWSSSTGRFTAPVAGSYSFTFNVDVKNHSSGYLLIRIRKNGSQMVGIYPDQTSAKERVTLNTILTLAAGDYMDVSWNNNYPTPIFSYASFSGFLIG